MTKQDYKDIYDVVGAAMEVHKTLGKDIIIELKSVESICSDHRAQLFNYMRITKKNRGLLLNFGEKSLRAERYLYISEDDNFVLLTQENYKDYISE